MNSEKCRVCIVSSDLAMKRYVSNKSPTIAKSLQTIHTLHATDDLRHFGGKYRPPIGTSTRDITDRQRDAEALADFEAELERVRFGVVSGREW